MVQNPEDSHLHIHRRENLKTHIIKMMIIVTYVFYRSIIHQLAVYTEDCVRLTPGFAARSFNITICSGAILLLYTVCPYNYNSDSLSHFKSYITDFILLFTSNFMQVFSYIS
jgi:hypothetical protein